MRLRSLVLAASLLFSTSALADDHQFKKGEAVNLAPDRAYILVRTIGKSCGLINCFHFIPIFVRSLSSNELEQAKALAQQYPGSWKDRVEPNVLEQNEPYEEHGDDDAYFLASVKPGTYVFWGLWRTSLCMGTVRFEAKAGTITDLGAMVGARDDKPTTIPELSHFVTGRPVGDDFNGFALAIRPATSATDVPETLRSLPRVPADYSAVQTIPNYTGWPLGRIAPLSGIIDYDKDGQVIDLRAGQSDRR